jgi:hypothetical protein
MMVTDIRPSTTPAIAETSATPALPAGELAAEEERWSLRLAVAQWLRSRRATFEAQHHLLELGISPDEVMRRRKAQSTDPQLAGLLRLAVTLIITRGRLEAADLRRLPSSLGAAALPAVIEATADAYASVLRAESNAGSGPPADFSLDIGDY